MILHSLSLTHVGKFRDSIRLGPLGPGINIVAAPNEFGKTTLLRATARALFDRHTTRSEEIKALQPAGSSLAPRISVEFETREGRFRIDKTFLLNPRCELQTRIQSRWERTAEGDAADQRLQALVQSTLPGKGATRPEHWGLLGFLWARQGEPAEWPDFDGTPTGSRVRARLARIELDPVAEAVRAHLASIWETILTPTGQIRTGGPLELAETELANMDSELASLRQARRDQDTTLERYQQASTVVLALEQELARHQASLTQLRERCSEAQRIRAATEPLKQALAAASMRLQNVHQDIAQLGQRRNELRAAQLDLEGARRELADLEARTAHFRQRIEACARARGPADRRLVELRSSHERLQAIVRIGQLAREAAALGQQLALASAASESLARFEAPVPTPLDIDPAQLHALEQCDEKVRTLRALVASSGLVVELRPDHDATATANDGTGGRTLAVPGGGLAELQAPRQLALDLKGWGRISIRSGSRDAEEHLRQLEIASAEQQRRLAEARVPSVEAAREAVQARRLRDLEHRNARSLLLTHLGKYPSLVELSATSEAMQQRLESLRIHAMPTTEEQAASPDDLESRAQSLAAEIAMQERQLRELETSLEEARGEERAAESRRAAASTRATELRGIIQSHELRIADLGAAYPAGIDESRRIAQTGFAEAEARVVTALEQLPQDVEQLETLRRQAEADVEAAARELQRRRQERDQAQGTLEARGGLGLYSRETALEERRAEAADKAAAARIRGWGARLAHDLIEHRKAAARRSALEPLEARLSDAFRRLTGDEDRRVFLDEQLRVAGIGRTRAEAHAFPWLSQGAREQLLLCLRIAVALELASDEPQVLILDDVLVNTDSARQKRVLDVLASVTPGLQVIILTCHPDRYLAVGTPAPLSTAPEPTR